MNEVQHLLMHCHLFCIKQTKKSCMLELPLYNLKNIHMHNNVVRAEIAFEDDISKVVISKHFSDTFSFTIFETRQIR